MIVYAIPTVEDIKYLSERLDPVDIEEIVTSSGSADIFDELLGAWKISDVCHIVKQDGDPIGIFGLAESPDNPLEGFPWGFFTDNFRDIPAKLLRDSKVQIEFWRHLYDRLIVFVHSENHRSIRYLEWLGFVHTGTVIPGLKNSSFKEYVRCATL